MSDIIPPSELPESLNSPRQPPSKKLCAFYGFLILVVSGPLSFIFPLASLVGLGLAIASLFYKGYGCIFVGYILTVGIILLAMIAFCSIYPPRFD